MMNQIYRIIHKLNKRITKNYILSQCKFKNKQSKNSVIIDEGVKILNPNVTFGKNVHLYNNVIIFGSGPVYIDDDTKIGFNTIIYSDENAGVYIGKRCSIAANAYIIDSNHSTLSLHDIDFQKDTYKQIMIHDDVWIAAECVIGKGSVLNRGAIVGANSFVNKEFPENAIIGGSPAKIIKYRGE